MILKLLFIVISFKNIPLQSIKTIRKQKTSKAKYTKNAMNMIILRLAASSWRPFEFKLGSSEKFRGDSSPGSQDAGQTELQGVQRRIRQLWGVKVSSCIDWLIGWLGGNDNTQSGIINPDHGTQRGSLDVRCFFGVNVDFTIWHWFNTCANVGKIVKKV